MKAPGIDEAKASSDVISPNLQQNIVVVSTPDRENASRDAPTPGDAPAPETDPNPGPVGGPVLEGSSRNTAGSRSRSKGRSSSRCRGGQVSFETRRSRSRDHQHGGQPSWADRVRQGAAEKVTRGSPPEYESDIERLAQLERENKEMRDTITRLMAEISEISSGGGQQPVEAITQSTQSMETPVVEECETERPAKKEGHS
ncbi:hypothetical protein MTO96_050107 [Rhipicephalus appendiculatus]